MAAKLKESVIHWKKKLERISDEDVILNVVHKLSKVPITLEILEETHIGKCIRNLSKRDDVVGEKALAVLKKWRTVFANGDSSSVTKKQKSSSVKENVNHLKSSSKSSSKTDASHVKSHKEILSKDSGIKSKKNSSHNSQSSETYARSNCNGNSSDESSLYTYEKKESASKYISYDPHLDVSEGYNPECPDFFPVSKPVKRKYESTVEEYEPSMKEGKYGSSVEVYEPSVKEKLREEKVGNESKPKKSKTDSNFYLTSNHISERKEEKHKKHSSHGDKGKTHSDNGHLSIKKEKDKVKSESDMKKKVSDASCSKKSKELVKNKEKSSKPKTKLKLNSTEEFTSSEVRFEDCLGFNDIVIKKKKSSKSTSQSTPKKVEKVVPVKEKPSSSRSSHHKESSTSSTVPKKSSSSTQKKMHVDVPKPKELAKLEEVDIMSTLPQTLPNYRPLPRVDFSSKKKEVLSNEDAILFMSSKREKTAVYSGRRTFYTEVPSLFEIATQVLIAHIDAIEFLGGVPYYLLKPVLEKCTPTQLYQIENYNPHLLDDTHELWEVHCKRDYKLLKLQENETYRELYLRAHEEQERKLKSITANISAAIAKSNPVRRQVKLAYVDSVVKPPRDVARRQAKNGTATPVSQPVKPGTSPKATPKPVTAAVVNSTASSHSSPASANFIPKKPKVAPLMAKTLKSMRQCFRRK